MSTEQDGPAEEPAGPAEDSTSTESTGPGGASDRATGSQEETSGESPREYLRGWFTGPAEIVVDREEITIVGTLPEPEGSAGSAEKSAAAEGRIKRFREETRSKRIEMAREAEHRFRRKVAWGARCGELGEMFTTLSVPVMTRLRQSERRVLDTLVDAGVARSRSDALAWCVRLTGEHADAWLTELRDALRRVEEVRSQGPANTTST